LDIPGCSVTETEGRASIWISRRWALAHQYIIRPDELPALNFLASDHPRPLRADWINRGTNQLLRQQSVDMLLRTLFADILSPSAVKLHRSSGLRLEFASDSHRLEFSRSFATAKAHELESRTHHLTMVFDDRSIAALAAEQLVEEGVPKAAISMLWRAGQFIDTDHAWLEGHSLLSVAGATASGGIAGATIGLVLFAIPGFGQIAAIGGLAGAALSTTPAISAIVGATAAAIGKMFSDPDVDDVALNQYISDARHSRVFVSVDLREAEDTLSVTRSVMKRHGGRPATRDSLLVIRESLPKGAVPVRS
jgi:hypothetical protein